MTRRRPSPSPSQTPTPTPSRSTTPTRARSSRSRRLTARERWPMVAAARRRDEREAPGHRVALRGLHRGPDLRVRPQLLRDRGQEQAAHRWRLHRDARARGRVLRRDVRGVDGVLEQFSTGKLDDVCDEDAKVVLADKDTFMNAVRAHHDFHVNMIDQREDALGSEERKRLDAVMAELRVWERGHPVARRGDPRAVEAAQRPRRRGVRRRRGRGRGRGRGRRRRGARRTE